MNFLRRYTYEVQPTECATKLVCCPAMLNGKIDILIGLLYLKLAAVNPAHLQILPKPNLYSRFSYPHLLSFLHLSIRTPSLSLPPHLCCMARKPSVSRCLNRLRPCSGRKSWQLSLAAEPSEARSGVNSTLPPTAPQLVQQRSKWASRRRLR